jgi:CRP-like cAMP-binding protein
MADAAREYLQLRVLRTLEPLSSLGADKLEELANKSTVEELPPGRVIFRQGEKDRRCVYLLAGQIELQTTGNPNLEIVKAKTLESKYPIAQEIPRPSTCRTKTNAVLLYIDSDLLEFLMDDTPSGTYEVTEIHVSEDPESDWMMRFLQSPAFLRLPTEKIHTLLVRFEEVPVHKGQTIIKQGDTDQWYYIVKEGQCLVSRRPAPSAEEIRLAILGPGDGFGEEALITNGRRNATVTMKDDGVLVRLSKKDFNELLVKPLLQHVNHHTMMEKARSGAAIIDVRTNKEFSENGIKGAQNIPLSMFRVKTASLNPTREHIVYCNDGGQSAAGAFLLAQHGISCFVLEGGLTGQQKPFMAAPSESPAEPIVSANIPRPMSAPTPVATPRQVATPNAHLATGEFQLHRRQAQTQAERANAAENAHKTAESRAQQLRGESNALTSQAHRLAAKTANAEADRKRAEEEIQRLQAEAVRQRDEMFATAKLAIAKEKEQALQEANQLKSESEAARKRAEEELQSIRREASEIVAKQARIDADYKKAEEVKRNAAQAAEVARHSAKLEAEKVKHEAEIIRQRALEEAQRVRQTLESQRAKLQADEITKRNAALEDARRRAEAAIQQASTAAEEARRQAQLEAEAIRRTAIEEAQRLRKEAESDRNKSARKHVEEQQRYQQLLEESRQRAYKEAQEQAEIDANAIRRQAIDEVGRLRAEMEETRQLFENHSYLAKTQIDEDDALLAEEEAQARAAEEDAAHAAAEATRRAQEIVARRRREEELRAIEAARRVAQQHDAARRHREEEAQRAAMEESRRVQEIARRATERKASAEEQVVRHRAEILKQRLQAQDVARQRRPDEFMVETGQGMKLSKAKLHVVNDKTVLEGEEDIFIFKAPSERPPNREEAEALIRQAEQQMREQSRKELPSFDIEYTDDKNKTTAHDDDNNKSGFSDSIVADLENLSAYNKPRNETPDEFEFSLPQNDRLGAPNQTHRGRRHLYTLAASVVVMITISVIAITRPTYVDVKVMAGVSDDKPQAEQRGLASMRTTPSNSNAPGQIEKNMKSDKASEENRVKSEAEEEFQRMLTKWRNDQQTQAKSDARR